MGRPRRGHRATTSFGPRSLEGAAAGLAVIAVVALIDAVTSKNATLIGLLIVVAGGGMALCISLIRTSRERSVDLLAVQADVSRILASADTLDVATPKLLATVGEQLGWEIGALWMVEAQTETIRWVGSWSAPGLDATRFIEASRTLAFGTGDGLPGRVWQAGRPVWVFDVLHEPDFSRVEEAAEIGLRAAFAFPVRGSRGVLGTIEYFARRPRRPDAHVLDLMDGLGGQLGEYMERKLAEEAVRESEARKTAVEQRMAAIVESSDDAILSKDHDLIIRSWNRGAERLYGYAPEEAIGQSIQLIIPDDRQGEEVELFKAVLRDERVEHYETQRVRKDGTKIDVSLTVSPIRDADGTLIGASVIGRDISESKRAARRASFLAEAQSVLSSTLDYEVTLRNLARLAVPQLADWCAIDMVAPDGSLERLALAHADPGKQRLADEIERRYPPRQDPGIGALKAVISHRSELIREIPSELLDSVAQDEEHARLIRRLGLRSAMIVPLVVRERALGAIMFVSAESGVPFGEDDLALAEDLAARAATAVDNARLYRERSYIADTLQRSLMPERLPDIPGLDLAARYRAAGQAGDVGGDFYDIFRTGESTWAVVIGDVRGKGPRAAVVTGLARYTLRTASLTESLPSRVLGTLNEAMLLRPEADRFCTVAYGSLQPAREGAIRMTLGVGGHPLPLLLRRDGSVDAAGSPGTLIGLVPDPDVVDEIVELQPGESLVFYTDGVSEARCDGNLFGEERLMDLVKGCVGLAAAEIAERIEADVLEFRDSPVSDDMAVLVLRVRDAHDVNGAGEAERLEPARKAAA